MSSLQLESDGDICFSDKFSRETFFSRELTLYWIWRRWKETLLQHASFAGRVRLMRLGNDAIHLLGVFRGFCEILP